MAAALAGYRVSLTSGGGAQSILGGFDGAFDVIVRATAAGIFIGGSTVASSLPATGFELVPDKDYELTAVAAADHEPYLATNSGSTVYAYVYLAPRL